MDCSSCIEDPEWPGCAETGSGSAIAGCRTANTAAGGLEVEGPPESENILFWETTENDIHTTYTHTHTHTHSGNSSMLCKGLTNKSATTA